MNEIKKAAIYSYLAMLASIITTILYTPILVKYLGTEEFGVYSLVGSFAAYLSILDLGLGNAVVKFIATNQVKGKQSKESSLIGTFIILFLCMSLLAFILGMTIYYLSEKLFSGNLDENSVKDIKKMILILTFSIVISLPLSIFGSVVQAYEKLILFKVMNLIRITSLPILGIMLVIFDFKSVALIIMSSIVNLIILLFFMIYSFKKLKIQVNFKKIEIKEVKEIVTYSFFIFLNVLVDQVYWNTGQFILGVKGSSIDIAIYAISIQFVRMYMTSSTAISGLFLPMLSKKVANNHSALSLTKLVIKVGKIQLYILFFIVLGFYFFGEYFLEIWVGNDYKGAYLIVLVLMSALTIPLSQNVIISLLQAMNKHIFRSVIFLFIAILNLIISLVIAKDYGGLGLAIVTASSLIFGNIIAMNIYYHSYIKLNMIDFFVKNSIFILIVPVVLILGNNFGFKKINNFNELILGILLYCFVYLTIVFLTLNVKEKNKIFIGFKKILLRLKNIFSKGENHV